MQNKSKNEAEPIIWQSLAWPSMIVQRVQQGADEIIGHGFVAGKSDQGHPLAYEYTVVFTKGWEVKNVLIRDRLHDRTIALRHQADKWYDGASNEHLPEFDSVSFIDISITPFTNTPPIRQLAFTGDQSQTINAIYFDENSFSLRKVQQIYRKLNDTTYQYQDIELPDFTAELTVDADGLVVDYEHLFRRMR